MTVTEAFTPTFPQCLTVGIVALAAFLSRSSATNFYRDGVRMTHEALPTDIAGEPPTLPTCKDP